MEKESIFNNYQEQRDVIGYWLVRLDNNDLPLEYLDYVCCADYASIYEKVMSDELLKYDGKNMMQATPDNIRNWINVCKKYDVSDNYFFFINCLINYIKGNNLQYGLCFLFGESKELRLDEGFNKLLQGIVNMKHEIDVLDYTECRDLTKEEYIETGTYDCCPFCGEFCIYNRGKYKENNSCQTCMSEHLEDKLYVSLEKILRNMKIQKF